MRSGVAKEMRRYLPRFLSKRLPPEVKIVEVSKSESQRLNLLYRKKNKAADVLSFRYGPNYGEILICPEVIRREAKEQGNTYKYQMTWMILHGILHLAGLHHEKSRAMAKRVASLEQKVLAKLASQVNL